MRLYTKKPVTVEAKKFDGSYDSGVDIVRWIKANSWLQVQLKVDHDNEVFYVVIPTLEGDMRANEGDYIIRGIKGEFYPCKPDVFEASYEPVGGGKHE
jgi:hypothetical protein